MQRPISPFPRSLRFRWVCAGVLLWMIAGLGGCRTLHPPDARGKVSHELSERFGSGISTPQSRGVTVIPPDVSLEDGMSEDEAARVALWNNAGLQDLLADLGISRAQLLDAGLINDPQFSIFLPVGPKQVEFTTFQAVDALWLRPIRVRAATLDLNRVSQSMVQNGLDTIRDARVAHADLSQALLQADVARQAESMRQQIADLARKRLAAGDISELEAITSQIDALQATAAAARAQQDVKLAQNRLRMILGLTMIEAPITIDHQQVRRTDLHDADLDDADLDDAERFVNTALAMRPDLRAAEIAIAATCERYGLAKRQFMNLEVIYDANGSGDQGFESGPGLRFTVPIFNRNRGGVAIAHAQYQKAARQYVTVRDQIVLEVRNAQTQLIQARENLWLLQNEILPALAQAQRLAQRNYEDGGTTYFLVLQTTGPYLDALMRESVLMNDVRRAMAQLERSVGMRLAESQPIESSPDGLLESLPDGLPESLPDGLLEAVPIP